MSLPSNVRSLVRPLIYIQSRGVKGKLPRQKVGPMKYVPPPDSNPQLVREESVLKSLVLERASVAYPISIKRLDEIRKSPNGWVPRKVPPPELPFEFKRNLARRFNIDIHTKRWKGRMYSYTIVSNIKGDLNAFKDCVQWRLGDKVGVKIDESKQTVIIAGHYKRQISMLIQGLGF